MKVKYEFIKQPPKGEFGQWITADGFKCFTDRRDKAVAMYKNYLKRNVKPIENENY